MISSDITSERSLPLSKLFVSSFWNCLSSFVEHESIDQVCEQLFVLEIVAICDKETCMLLVDHTSISHDGCKRVTHEVYRYQALPNISFETKIPIPNDVFSIGHCQDKSASLSHAIKHQHETTVKHLKRSFPLSMFADLLSLTHLALPGVTPDNSLSGPRYKV